MLNEKGFVKYAAADAWGTQLAYSWLKDKQGLASVLWKAKVHLRSKVGPLLKELVDSPPAQPRPPRLLYKELARESNQPRRPQLQYKELAREITKLRLESKRLGRNINKDFEPGLNAKERWMVHDICERQGLRHTSHGQGKNRFVRICIDVGDTPLMGGKLHQSRQDLPQRSFTSLEQKIKQTGNEKDLQVRLGKVLVATSSVAVAASAVIRTATEMEDWGAGAAAAEAAAVAMTRAATETEKYLAELEAAEAGIFLLKNSTSIGQCG